MAERAPRGPGAGGLVLEVAQDACRSGDGDVAALHDLRMAGGAAKALAAPHAGEMRRVIEQDVAEQLLAREESPLVTDQAGGIVDLGPGIGAVRAGEIARDHREGFVLLSELVLEAGRDMALDAGDVVMRRLRPGFEIRLHDMAR